MDKQTEPQIYGHATYFADDGAAALAYRECEAVVLAQPQQLSIMKIRLPDQAGYYVVALSPVADEMIAAARAILSRAHNGGEARDLPPPVWQVLGERVRAQWEAGGLFIGHYVPGLPVYRGNAQ